MTALIVIGIIVLALLALSFMRVGVTLKYDENGFSTALHVGFIHVTLKSKKKDKKQKKEKPKEESSSGKGGKVKVVEDLLPDILEAIRRFKRKLRVDKLIVHYTAAGSDPARVAVEYGAGNAFMGIILPVLENNFDVEERDLKVEADFKGGESKVFLMAKLTLATWHVFHVANAILIPLLKKRGRSGKNKKSADSESDKTVKEVLK